MHAKAHTNKTLARRRGGKRGGEWEEDARDVMGEAFENNCPNGLRNLPLALALVN